MIVQNNIELPQDQYRHPGTLNEWWWHIGSLTAGDRVFGFEINAASRDFSGQYLFTQIMLSDVANQIHYQQTTSYPASDDWAQDDPDQPWYAALGAAGSDGAVAMHSPPGDIGQMSVVANFVDKATGVAIGFDLQMTINSLPLLVWGTGRSPQPAGTGPTPLDQYNYYYSFTKIKTSGTVSIGDESFSVSGVTWMDHEYGAFNEGTTWILQDAQLDNGVCLSTFIPGQAPAQGVRTPSVVSILDTLDNSTFHDSFTTLLGPSWTSPEGVVYNTRMTVEIPSVGATLDFSASIPGQEFTNAMLPVYEGVATVSGTYENEPVTGTAWIEQALGPVKSTSCA